MTWNGPLTTFSRAAPINFIGNVEGRDLATDRADVMVTDGFTGNIVVKTSEGAIQIVALYLLEELSTLDPEVQEAVDACGVSGPAASRLGDLRRSPAARGSKA